MRGYAAAPPEQEPPAAAVVKTGLLPPVLVVFEGPGRAGPDDARSAAAAEAVQAAFISEMAGKGASVEVITPDEAGPPDRSRLLDVPGRIARDAPRPFPETLLEADHAAPAMSQVMERHHLDAVWVVSGAQVGDRLLLRIALRDRQGTVLYSDVLDRSAPGDDLRDPAAAGRAVKTLLAEYRTEEKRKEAAAADAAAGEKAAEAVRREQETPAELQIGLGVFFFAADGVDLLISFRPRHSHWQAGYRYVRWTDEDEDPFTGTGLTETTERMHGPFVNYLFRPEKRYGTWYLGMSVLRWSRTETALMTGASDSDAVTAPFFGGGWAGRIGTHVFYNIGMFVSPGTDLRTDTGVSSDESSGGFDVQLQMGASF